MGWGMVRFESGHITATFLFIHWGPFVVWVNLRVWSSFLVGIAVGLLARWGMKRG